MKDRIEARAALHEFVADIAVQFDQLELLNAADTRDGPCFQASRHVGAANIYAGCLFGRGFADVTLGGQSHRFALQPNETASIIRALKANGYLCEAHE